MVTVITIEEMVQEVLDKADEVEERKHYWAKEEPDMPEMQEMVIGDANDLREGAELIKQCKFVEAYEKFSYMDTSAREQVPNNAWDYCQQKASEHYKKIREADKKA
jgi:hypothetical protein